MSHIIPSDGHSDDTRMAARDTLKSDGCSDDGLGSDDGNVSPTETEATEMEDRFMAPWRGLSTPRAPKIEIKK